MFSYRIGTRSQYLDETLSTASTRSRQTTILSRVDETDSVVNRSGFDSHHSTPYSTPLTTRTSSLKAHRPMPAHSSSSIYSFADDNKSQQAVTLQTFLLSVEDRSSSEKSNQWSSSDISSTRSYSAVSVPVTSHDKTRPHQGSIAFGTSISSSATGGMGELHNTRFPSPAGKRETGENVLIRNESSETSIPIPSTGLTASVDAAEELHKLRLQL